MYGSDAGFDRDRLACREVVERLAFPQAGERFDRGDVVHALHVAVGDRAGEQRSRTRVAIVDEDAHQTRAYTGVLRLCELDVDRSDSGGTAACERAGGGLFAVASGSDVAR